MQGSTKIPITDLNAYITCKICNGYFVDASTIIECLHTFCRSCIIKYFQKNKYCPVCDVQVHKSKPLLNIRPDKTLQDIVYKLVPRLFQNEMQRRRNFYENHPEAKPSSLEQCGEVAYQYLLTPEETICLTLSYHGADNKPRYLRCPAAVTMGHLKKLIRAKYDLSENHRVDILYNQDCLSSSLTLMDIAYIYLWKRKGPIELTYRIYENTAKKLKLDYPKHSEVSEETNYIVNNNNVNNISNNNNWKEVQLRISENGEMSITGIQDALSPSLLEIVNSEPKYKNDLLVEDLKSVNKQVPKELPDLKYIGKIETSCTMSTTLSDSRPVTNVDRMNSMPSFNNTLNSAISTFCMPSIPSTGDHLPVSLPSASSSCATLSSGTTTMVFSTINTTKCSTKTQESSIQAVKPEEFIERLAYKEGEKTLKRKLEPNSEIEPLAKQPKPIILNHNMGLLNLSNNHPLKKHSKMNRNGENVKDIPKPSTTTGTKTTESIITSTAQTLTRPIDVDLSKPGLNKKAESEVSKVNFNKNLSHVQSPRPGTPTSVSKPLAMRAKTLISESGVKPPCYQPRTIYSPLINVPKPLTTAISVTTGNLSSKAEVHIPTVVCSRASTVQKTDKPIITLQSLQPSKNSMTTISDTNQSHSNQSFKNKISYISVTINPSQQSSMPTSLGQPVTYATSKTTSSNPVNQSPSNLTGDSTVPSSTPCTNSQSPIQGTTNKISTSNPSQQTQLTQSTSTKVSTTTAASSHTSQNAVSKTSNSSIKAKPSTPIGYKTLRDPPKSWNSQISKANLSKSSPDPKYPDLKNVRPAKFFKMRNNIPRYLGNPASGVKPMYQVHVSPEKDKPSETGKLEKTEIKKHSIVKIDPKTLKPISEKAPETTSLSNHSTIHPTTNLNSHIMANSQIYTNPNQCFITAPTTMNSGGLNIQNDLKINTSSVSIFNPLKLQSSPKNERKSPKSPHSPKMKSTSPTGSKRDNKINRNFTPPNPFVPNIPSKTLSPNQFIYPAIPPGFPAYDPRVMAAYYNQWYGQRIPFPPTALTGLNLDLNQRKNLEMLASVGSPKMDALTQSMLGHQMSPRPASTNISLLQRSHNIPLSTTITKPTSTPKKLPKDSKTDKSLETVVEKMTQNRNKISMAQNDSSNIAKKEQEASKSELPKPTPSVEDTGTSDYSNVKKHEDQKLELNTVAEKVDSGTNELLTVVSCNPETSIAPPKVDTEAGVEPTKSLKPPKDPLKSNCTTDTPDRLKPLEQTEKVLKMPEKENLNLENISQSKGDIESSEVIRNEQETVCEAEAKEKSQVEVVKEKE